MGGVIDRKWGNKEKWIVCCLDAYQQLVHHDL